MYLAPLFGMLYLTTLEIPLFLLMSSKAIKIRAVERLIFLIALITQLIILIVR